MKYGTISIDPPWPENGGGKCKRGADRHYKTMSIQDIARTIWTCPMFTPADSAHLYMWATNNYLPQAIAMMPELGFRYINNIVWVKMRNDFYEGQSILISERSLQLGLGQYQRGSHELLLFGTRGNAMVPAPENRFPSVVFAPRTKHSKKPDAFYKRIPMVSPGPYLEMFARDKRSGWDCWGDEVE